MPNQTNTPNSPAPAVTEPNAATTAADQADEVTEVTTRPSLRKLVGKKLIIGFAVLAAILTVGTGLIVGRGERVAKSNGANDAIANSDFTPAPLVAPAPTAKPQLGDVSACRPEDIEVEDAVQGGETVKVIRFKNKCVRLIEDGDVKTDSTAPAAETKITPPAIPQTSAEVETEDSAQAETPPDQSDDESGLPPIPSDDWSDRQVEVEPPEMAVGESQE